MIPQSASIEIGSGAALANDERENNVRAVLLHQFMAVFGDQMREIDRGQDVRALHDDDIAGGEVAKSLARTQHRKRTLQSAQIEFDGFDRRAPSQDALTVLPSQPHSRNRLDEKSDMKVIGLAGWSGAGKTTLLQKLLPELVGRRLTVSTIKHAHHAFEVDTPGKDSYEHRKAGAFEVLVTSSQRFALMRDLRGAPEPSLAAHLARLAPVDLVIVEGFRREAIPKIEVFRAANGKSFLHVEDDTVAALVSDLPEPPKHLPHASLNDVEAVADLVLRFAADQAAVRGTRPSIG